MYENKYNPLVVLFLVYLLTLPKDILLRGRASETIYWVGVSIGLLNKGAKR